MKTAYVPIDLGTGSIDRSLEYPSAFTRREDGPWRLGQSHPRLLLHPSLPSFWCLLSYRKKAPLPNREGRGGGEGEEPLLLSKLFSHVLCDSQTLLTGTDLQIFHPHLLLSKTFKTQEHPRTANTNLHWGNAAAKHLSRPTLKVLWRPSKLTRRLYCFVCPVSIYCIYMNSTVIMFSFVLL